MSKIQKKVHSRWTAEHRQTPDREKTHGSRTYGVTAGSNSRSRCSGGTVESKGCWPWKRYVCGHTKIVAKACALSDSAERFCSTGSSHMSISFLSTDVLFHGSQPLALNHSCNKIVAFDKMLITSCTLTLPCGHFSDRSKHYTINSDTIWPYSWDTIKKIVKR